MRTVSCKLHPNPDVVVRTFTFILCTALLAVGCGGEARRSDETPSQLLLDFYVPGARLSDSLGAVRQRVPGVSFAPYSGYRASLAQKPDGFENVMLVAGESIEPEQELPSGTPVNEVTLFGPARIANSARRRVQEAFGDVQPAMGCRIMPSLGELTVIQWEAAGTGALLIVGKSLVTPDSANATLTLYRGRLDSQRVPNSKPGPCS